MRNTVAEITAARDLLIRKARRTASTRPSASRVAAAALEKRARSNYDHLIRAFMLEGAAGIRPMTWANNNARANLGKAADHFKDHKGMHPDWFAAKDTGTWKIIENRVGSVFRQFRLDESEKFDILNSALYGLGTDGGQNKIPPYETGKYAAQDIMSGDETPQAIAIGYGGKLFVRKALSAAKKYKRQQALRGQSVDVWEHGDILEDNGPQRGFGDVLVDILTNPGNKVGDLVRKFIRSTYANTSQEPVASYYFETLFEKGKLPPRKEIAAAVWPEVVSNPKAMHAKQSLVYVQLSRTVLPRLGVMWRKNERLQNIVEHEVARLGGSASGVTVNLEKLFESDKGVNLKRFARTTLDEINQIFA